MPYATDVKDFALFQQQLLGTWSNKNFPGSRLGGDTHPLSYNIMPLPQISAQPGQPDYPGYVLKNFKYYETIRFNDGKAIASPATAPNRGGRFTQDARALFYDQKVSFAEGPEKGNVVHIENGTWLSLETVPQALGPYGHGGNEKGEFPPQPPWLTVAKQIAVPHGNSVLALGSYALDGKDPVFHGSPVIKDAAPPYPDPDYLSVEPYATQRNHLTDFQNPHPDLATQPNRPLQEAVDIIKPDAYLYWHVTTELRDYTEPVLHESDKVITVKGKVTNIPFEQKVSRVTEYWADYWLLSTDKGKSFDYLAYTQTMLMSMTIGGLQYSFPHVTCNTLTRA